MSISLGDVPEASWKFINIFIEDWLPVKNEGREKKEKFAESYR